VLGDTLVPKNTTGVLGESRAATNEGVAILRERIPGFDFKTTPMGAAEECFGLMEPNVRRRVKANFVDRDLCQEARRMLSQSRWTARSWARCSTSTRSNCGTASASATRS